MASCVQQSATGASHPLLAGCGLLPFVVARWGPACRAFLLPAQTAQLKLMCVQAVCETLASVPVTWKRQRVLVLGFVQLLTEFNLEKEKAVRVCAR